ncbi:MAG: hypothetical protein MZW92_40285 [Comamonadaceae bacterium]|nr:hypothetical protein [Comamonadaceae bacterium]
MLPMISAIARRRSWRSRRPISPTERIAVSGVRSSCERVRREALQPVERLLEPGERAR